MISAKIIADSKNEFGNRLTTFVLTFPRVVLAEFNTHRMISRNSASSRAIPFEKLLKAVEETPFVPIKWMKNHKGMQGTEYFDASEVVDLNLEHNWLSARDAAIENALLLSKAGLTKQVINRLLEPFMYHTVIATATEWENFFALRAHEAAEIHIQALAHKMLEVYNKSTPKQLQAGEWHIPFGDSMDEDKIKKLHYGTLTSQTNTDALYLDTKIKVAVARCARISYTVIGEEGKPDNYENDVKLHDMLSSSGHYSPFEHCAKVMSPEQYYWNYPTFNGDDSVSNKWNEWSGNFRGFIQYRKTLTGENKTDNRVVKK